MKKKARRATDDEPVKKRTSAALPLRTGSGTKAQTEANERPDQRERCARSVRANKGHACRRSRCGKRTRPELSVDRQKTRPVSILSIGSETRKTGGGSVFAVASTPADAFRLSAFKHETLRPRGDFIRRLGM